MSTSKITCCVPKCNKTRKDGTVLHVFPNPVKDKDRYELWIKAIGIDNSLEPHLVHEKRRVCHDHFEAKFLTWSKRLSPNAVPSLNLPSQKNTVEEDNPTESQTIPTERFEEDTPIDDQTLPTKKESDIDLACTEVEYLEEAEAPDSDYRDNMKRCQDTLTPSKVMFTKNYKLKFDDIDLLFLSYAKTFRSLAKQFQSMLKLDIAKLFSRYELKNASLPPQEKPAEPPSQSEEIESEEIDPPPPEEMNQTPENVSVTGDKNIKRVCRRASLEAVPANVDQAASTPKDVQAVSTFKNVQATSTPEVEEANTPYLTILPLPGNKSQVKKMFKPNDLIRTIYHVSPQGKLVPKLPDPQAINYDARHLDPIVKLKRLDVASGVQTEIPALHLNPRVRLQRLDVRSRVQDVIPARTVPKPMVQAALPGRTLPKPIVQTVLREHTVPKPIKYFVPKTGPAYAIVSKEDIEEELKEEDVSGDTEQEMECHTETVFVATDDGAYSELET